MPIMCRLCAARYLWPAQIRPHVARTRRTALVLHPAVVGTPLTCACSQISLHREPGVFLSAYGQLLPWLPAARQVADLALPHSGTEGGWRRFFFGM